jgi:hypothetical protein
VALLALLLAAVSFGIAIKSPLAALWWAHAAFAVLGGVALAGAHWINLRAISRFEERQDSARSATASRDV